MKLSNNPVSHDVHYTLAYGDQSVSEWREVDVGRYDGFPLPFIENLVAGIAKEMVRSGRVDKVWYHGIVLSESPLSAGAFCGEVFVHEGAVCMTDIGRTGLLVTPGESARTQ